MSAPAAVSSLRDRLSTVEKLCAAVGVDPGAGLQIVDAAALGDPLTQPGFPSPWAPLVILDLCSAQVATEVQRALLRQYPPEHAVRVVADGGTEVRDCSIAALHPQASADQPVALWVPPAPALQPRSSLRTLEVIVARLRAPDGCPWDREQTHHTIKRNLLEETYELLEALDAEDAAAQTEELGDLLMQVFLHAQMAREAGEYDLGDVTAGITDKLVRRHPHVFGDVTVSGAEEVLRNWEAIKKSEGKGKASVLEGLPPALPALTMAMALCRRAASSGFTWPDATGAWAKFEEELGEFRVASGDGERKWELGDVLLTLVNLARLQGYDAEECLREANARFRRRFMTMEGLAAERGQPLPALPLEELLGLWEETSPPPLPGPHPSTQLAERGNGNGEKGAQHGSA